MQTPSPAACRASARWWAKIDASIVPTISRLDRFIDVDRVSRTSVPGVYAAGDCTGVNMLASVAAMQGRIAMWHALGEAVAPLKLSTVASTVFTHPELAAVGASENDVRSGRIDGRSVTLPLNTNPRAKMNDVKDGFVKLISAVSSSARGPANSSWRCRWPCSSG